LPVRLAISGKHHQALRAHLFSGDGKEAVAFALCGRARRSDLELLLVQDILPVPYDACIVRTPSRVTWPGVVLDPILTRALEQGLALVKIHSHPNGYPWFSSTDDESEAIVFPSVFGWLGDQGPMASMIMFPDGKMVGRAMYDWGIGGSLQAIRVAGDDFLFWFGDQAEAVPTFATRIAQTFGEHTFASLRKLKVGVVGASGTGSVVAEILVRNGIGHIVYVDPDYIEDKNLNRILNSTSQDSRDKLAKVEVQKRAAEAMDLGTVVHVHPYDLMDMRALLDLSTCDVIFGCMDSVDGRHLLNKLVSAFLIPYIDIGVRLDSDGQGGIESIWLAIHTLQPGGSSLKSRKVYDQADLEAAFLYRSSPLEYARLKKEGYVKGVPDDRPAVISVNMEASARAVNEFLARIHGFRLEPNSKFAIRRISLTDEDASMNEADGTPCPEMARVLGSGDKKPFLGMMALEVGAC